MNNGREFWNAPVAMTVEAQKWHKASAITSPYDSNPLGLTLFVSCFNQESSILATLDTIIEAMRIVAMSYEIIVIDDASKDRSVELLRRYIETHAGTSIVLRINTYRKGLAQNYADAAFIGRGKYYRLIPGDNAEPMETTVDIMKATGEADIVIPYYIASMQEAAPRQVMALGYTWLLNVVTGNQLNEYNGSPIHLRFNVMRWHCDNQRCGFQASLLCHMLDLGFTCKQVPCRTVQRPTIGWENILSLPSILVDILLRRISGWIKAG